MGPGHMSSAVVVFLNLQNTHTYTALCGDFLFYGVPNWSAMAMFTYRIEELWLCTRTELKSYVYVHVPNWRAMPMFAYRIGELWLCSRTELKSYGYVRVPNWRAIATFTYRIEELWLCSLTELKSYGYVHVPNWRAMVMFAYRIEELWLCSRTELKSYGNVRVPNWRGTGCLSGHLPVFTVSQPWKLQVEFSEVRESHIWSLIIFPFIYINIYINISITALNLKSNGNRRFITAFTKARNTCPHPKPHESGSKPKPHFLNIGFSMILPSIPRSSMWTLTLTFPHQNPVGPFPLPHTYYIPRQSQPSFFIWSPQ